MFKIDSPVIKRSQKKNNNLLYTINDTLSCDRSEKNILPVHFGIALVLTSEMAAQVLILIFRRYLGKSKWKFPLHAEPSKNGDVKTVV